MMRLRAVSCYFLALAIPFAALAQKASPKPPKPSAAKLKPGFLGVFMHEGDNGEAVVREMPSDSPAAKAGVRIGDAIIEADGKKIMGPAALHDAMQGKHAGDVVALKVLRDGMEESVKITLGERPNASEINLADETEQPQPRIAKPNVRPFRELKPDGGQWRLMPGDPPGMRKLMLGVQMQKIDDDLRKRLKLGEVLGVLVAEVVPKSPAEKAGIKAEDVIFEADGKKIAEPGDLTKLVGSKKSGDKLSLKVWRAGKEMPLQVVLEEVTPPSGPRTFRWEFDGANPPRLRTPDGVEQWAIPDLLPGNRQTIQRLEAQVKKLEAEVRRLTEEQQKLQRQMEKMGGQVPKR